MEKASELLTLEGHFSGEGKKFAIVVSRFNEVLCERLLKGAVQGFIRHQVLPGDLTIIRCPGAFELPLAAKKAAETKKFDAVVCLGAVVRGDTPHFDFVAGECASGISRVALETGVPIIFGVLTTNTEEQAWQRAGVGGGNKGYDAALTAIEMANLLQKIGS